MHTLRILITALLLATWSLCQLAFAENISLLPKYGSLPKNEAQKKADQQFLAEIDSQYSGDRKKAAADIASSGWQFLRQGNNSAAIKRFNQAWLLDSANGNALWGMAVVSSNTGNTMGALALFLEAQRSVGGDIDFDADYARTVGIVGAERKDGTLIKNAFARFASVYERAPLHTLNLQNWAITLFYIGDYAEAWKKIQLAEATPRRADLDPNFIAALQGKMPRP